MYWDAFQSLEDVLIDVCSRPAMFGAHKDLDPIITFLFGFAAGRGGDFPEELRNFLDWFGEEAHRLYCLPRNYATGWLMAQIYPDLTEATDALPQIYRCYKEGKRLKRAKRHTTPGPTEPG